MCNFVFKSNLVKYPFKALATGASDKLSKINARKIITNALAEGDSTPKEVVEKIINVPQINIFYKRMSKTKHFLVANWKDHILLCNYIFINVCIDILFFFVFIKAIVE